MLLEAAAFFVVSAAAVLGWVQLYFSRRDKRLEHSARLAAEARTTAAEAQLVLMQRRGSAPLFVPCMTHFRRLTVPGDSGNSRQLGYVDPKGARLLCFEREEVACDLAPNTPVYLVVENVKETPVLAVLKLDGQPIELHTELATAGESRSKLSYIYYLFVPEKHGQRQTLEVWFEASSGVQDSHRYELIHGKRSLRRIDPPALLAAETS